MWCGHACLPLLTFCFQASQQENPAPTPTAADTNVTPHFSSNSVRGFPFLLQGGEEVWTAVGAEELVVLDDGGGADAGRGERTFDTDDAGGEADADGVGESHVRGEGESDLEFGAGG